MNVVEIRTVEHNEKLLAAAAHGSGIFFPIMGPLVVLLINARKSRYVACHAVSALSGALILSLILFIGAAISVAWSVYGLYGHWQADWKEFSIWPILVKSVAVWILVLLIGFINTIISIFQAIGAYSNGRLPGGISGRIGRRFARIERTA